MLRASSLGLAFTHGISRRYLLRSHCLHQQLCHETHPIPSTLSHLHTQETLKMSKGLPPSDGTDTGTATTVAEPSPDETNATSNTNDLSLQNETKSHRAASSTHPDLVRRGPSQATEGSRRPAPPRYIFSRYAYRDHRIRQPLYEKMVETTNPDEAWQTYEELLKYRPPHLEQSIPHKYLHAFAASLVSRSETLPPQKTRTQSIFLRLLSVLNTIYHTGGQVRLWEWNALIECAGRGWRKTRMDDFQAALKIYQDMVANRAPGSSFSKGAESGSHDPARIVSHPVKPDIVTYNTLLSIAGRTLNPRVMRIAEELLASSGVSPDRITYLIYQRYYARKGKLSGVRKVTARLLENGCELGMEGVNSLLWAYGRNGRLDLVEYIYCILRHNLLPDTPPTTGLDAEDSARQLEWLESLTIPSDLKPDAITYYTVIQVYAYHGRLRESLHTFSDMISSPVPITGKVEDVEEFEPGATFPSPIIPIYRALFLGFARHALPPGTSASEAERRRPDDREHVWRAWTFEQLYTIFDDFMSLPFDSKPNTQTVYWLLVAFATTSGYNQEVLRNVLERVEARFGTERWERRLRVLREKILAEQFDSAYFEWLRQTQERRGWEG
ncbi:hypothetical protein GY45DRAFT_808701 [Cubamyces sp. BRFM 1775]|nr:hypothetical protein GY45DRAFT_808701 [Cubamyces sp. BRFM 1775]